MVSRFALCLLGPAARAGAVQLVPFPSPLPGTLPPRPRPTGGQGGGRCWGIVAAVTVSAMLLPSGGAQAGEPSCLLRGRPWIEGRARPALESAAALVPSARVGVGLGAGAGSPIAPAPAAGIAPRSAPSSALTRAVDARGGELIDAYL